MTEARQRKWLTGIGGAGVMVLVWTLGWGFGFGGLIELLVDPDGEIVDIWFTAMAIPGFIGGIVFSALLRIAEGRRLGELSLARFTRWGVLTGLVVGALGITSGMARAVTLTPALALIVGAVLGAVAALGSAIFFRLLARGLGAGREAVRARSQ